MMSLFQKDELLDAARDLSKHYKIEDIYKKILNHERLSIREGEKLYAIENPLVLGSLAHIVRLRMHGLKTTYVINQHINYTNICENKCLFCSFYREKGEEGAFCLSLEDIEKKLIENMDQPITEVHIVGGCHPDLGLDYYIEMLRLVRSIRPKAVLKCFTPVEIYHFSKKEGLSVEEVLKRLKEAGLDMLPGGGAEIFDTDIRKKICPNKISGEKWLYVCETAHKMGIKTNCTMLFGHIETIKERLDHLDRLRRLQDKTGGFLCFIPLPFQIKNNKLKLTKKISGIEELKTIAISRLMLDNIPHIKSYWIMLGVKQAQTALYFGADDFDGTVVEEKIGHMAGAESPMMLTRKEIEDMIKGCGFVPVQRNGFFERIS